MLYKYCVDKKERTPTMLNYIKNNKSSVTVLVTHILLIVIDSENTTLAWIVATLWMLAFLYMEYESKSVIDLHKRYIDHLKKENKNLNDKISSLSPEVNK